MNEENIMKVGDPDNGYARAMEAMRNASVENGKAVGIAVGTPRSLPLPQWDDLVARHNAALDKCGLSHRIDEVSIIVPDDRVAMEILREAVRDGAEFFNSAVDHVNTSPIVSRYTVLYDFLRLPGRNYRVEMMRITGGVSPLHSAVEVVRPFVPIHVSFKVKDGEEFAWASSELERHGWDKAQHCASTYGAFSYFRKDRDSYCQTGEIYLKPRVNLRDQEG